MTPEDLEELNKIYYNKNGKLRSTPSLKELLRRAIEQNKPSYLQILIQDEIKRREQPGWERMPPHPF